MQLLTEWSSASRNVIHCGDALRVLRTMPSDFVDCVVTSPPYYGLRNYNDTPGQLGLEATPDQYVNRMVAIFREVRRVLKESGTAWLNLGDSYANDGKWGGATGGKHVDNLYSNSGVGRRKTTTGLKPKDLIGIPWRVAFALQADGWWLRSDIIWHKPNPMPESVTDRPTKAHEYIFLLTKAARYYYDADAIREPHTDNTTHRDPGTRGRQSYSVASGINTRAQRDSNGGLGKHPLGRNKRTVWTIPTQPSDISHYAMYPPPLIEPCILAGCPYGGLVLDPFIGTGTTALVARDNGRDYVGCDIDPISVQIARDQLALAYTPPLFDPATMEVIS